MSDWRLRAMAPPLRIFYGSGVDAVARRSANDGAAPNAVAGRWSSAIRVAARSRRRLPEEGIGTITGMDAISFPANVSCPIAHALDVLGDKWTLLILREVLSGKTRFAEFREIGIPREVLSQRLSYLQDQGVLVKRPYKEAGLPGSATNTS